jgi:hypothetical protein
MTIHQQSQMPGSKDVIYINHIRTLKVTIQLILDQTKIGHKITTNIELQKLHQMHCSSLNVHTSMTDILIPHYFIGNL